MNHQSKPLVYSCSGCSNVAQLANDVALDLNQKQFAQMSCIAGVGGKVPGLVKIARSGRKIIALDGCHLHCVKSCLSEVGVEADVHLTLADEGLKKTKYNEVQQDEVSRWSDLIIARFRSSH
jgi:uncharacterized metal-binding protein